MKIILLLSLLPLVLAADSPTEKEFIGDRRVKLMPTAVSWFAALQSCKEEKLQLLTIHNEAENNQLEAIMDKHQVKIAWMAGTDNGHEGTWLWATDKSSIQYTNWAYFHYGRVHPQPDNYAGVEHCLQMDLTWSARPKTWNDAQCDLPIQYFCEESPKTVKERQEKEELLRKCVQGEQKQKHDGFVKWLAEKYQEYELDMERKEAELATEILMKEIVQLKIQLEKQKIAAEECSKN